MRFLCPREISAFGGLDLKLSFPSLQKGTNEVVFILPAIRSGRSVKKTVAGLTPVKVNLLVVLSNLRPFELCTNKNSAVSSFWAVADLRKVNDDAVSADAATNRRLVVLVDISSSLSRWLNQGEVR
jgi:hypothetical protein